MVSVSAARSNGGADGHRPSETVALDVEIERINRKIDWIQKELSALNKLMSAAKHDDTKKLRGASGKQMIKWREQLRHQLNRSYREREKLQNAKARRDENSFTT